MTLTMLDPHNIFKPFSKVNWEDLQQINRAAKSVLPRLAMEKETLLSMVESLRRNLTLLNRCESDEFSDRLILYANTNDQFTVRLNLRASIPYEQPHNHRSSFAALILSGS